MRTILSKLTEAWSFLVFLWPLLSQSSLPTRLPWEPSYLSGPSPGGPAWLSFSFPHEFALLSSHLPCLKDKFCFVGILQWLTFCTVVLIVSCFCYCLNLFITVFFTLVFILQVFQSPLEQQHCKSSINIIQLKICAYFRLSIGLQRPITMIVRNKMYRTPPPPQFLRLGAKQARQ